MNLKSRFRRSQNRTSGPAGERTAEAYLSKKSWKTITRNYSCRFGEIDLIMADGDSIVFVEVKNRKNEDFTPAETIITYPKKKRLTLTAKHFISEYRIKDRPLRFDAVIITGKEIRHYRNAFSPA